MQRAVPKRIQDSHSVLPVGGEPSASAVFKLRVGKRAHKNGPGADALLESQLPPLESKLRNFLRGWSKLPPRNNGGYTLTQR